MKQYFMNHMAIYYFTNISIAMKNEKSDVSGTSEVIGNVYRMQLIILHVV